jgi:hypothetical protein
MPFSPGHSLSFLRTLVALLTITALSLTAPASASAKPQQPDQPSKESLPTKEASTAPQTKAFDQAQSEASDQIAQNNVPNDDEAPHLDNKQTITIAAKWKRLGKNQIWINHEDKQVMVRGRICLQEGPLEMFACPGNTKAHESVIASEAKASEIHACLEALGFPPGKPCQWDPEYTPATGPVVKILVGWKEGDKFVQVNAREMVRTSGTGKPLEKDWVFGGSQIYHDNVSGENIYYADSGEMVCLSNFSTAMLDVQLESSDAADGLLFEANKEKIPLPNTKVYMILVPRKAETKPTGSSPKDAEAKNGKSANE